jgi:RNA polymerase sigma-70 factor (ECF subfamily)
LDLALIRRCQAGEVEAFTELFETYKNLVFRTAFLMLDSVPEADDILQEVFVQVYRSLKSYDPAKGAFTTWLYRITVNKCLNRRRHWTFFTPSLDAMSDRDLPTTAGPDDQRADHDLVQQALKHLSAKLRIVVILRFYGELSYAEISEVLELPLGTIKSRLNLALRTLQARLKDELDPALYTIKAESK